MAHHNSTPASVLKAPERKIRMVVQHVGLTRAQRRHPLMKVEPNGTIVTTFDKTWWRLPATNVPFRCKPAKAPSRRDLHRAAVAARKVGRR